MASDLKLPRPKKTRANADSPSNVDRSPASDDLPGEGLGLNPGATDAPMDKDHEKELMPRFPCKSPDLFDFLGAAGSHTIRKTTEPYISLSAHVRAEQAQSNSSYPSRDGRDWSTPPRRSASPSPSPSPTPYNARHPAIFRGYRTLDSWIAGRDRRAWDAPTDRSSGSFPHAPRKLVKPAGAGDPYLEPRPSQARDGTKKRMRGISPEGESSGGDKGKRQRGRDGEWRRRRDARRSLEDIFGKVTEQQGTRGPRGSLALSLED